MRQPSQLTILALPLALVFFGDVSRDGHTAVRGRFPSRCGSSDGSGNGSGEDAKDLGCFFFAGEVAPCVSSSTATS